MTINNYNTTRNYNDAKDKYNEIKNKIKNDISSKGIKLKDCLAYKKSTFIGRTWMKLTSGGKINSESVNEAIDELKEKHLNAITNLNDKNNKTLRYLEGDINTIKEHQSYLPDFKFRIYTPMTTKTKLSFTPNFIKKIRDLNRSSNLYNKINNVNKKVDVLRRLLENK